jgi:hypothetical protein
VKTFDKCKYNKEKNNKNSQQKRKSLNRGIESKVTLAFCGASLEQGQAQPKLMPVI